MLKSDIKKWKTYQIWKKHKEFFEKEKRVEKQLIYMFNLLEKKRAFKYAWIFRCNELALKELLGLKSLEEDKVSE